MQSQPTMTANAGDILLVDDDPATRKMLRFVLEQLGGHRVHEAATPQEAASAIADDHQRYDLVMLDVMMPGLDGFELCKRVRTQSNVPVLMVSARGDVGARVHGLQIGADDYLAKPFDPTELNARVEALIRRTRRTPRADTQGRMRVGDLLLDLGAHRVEIRQPRGGTREAQLTPTEFKLLLVLARSAGEAVSRETLLEAIWGPTAAHGLSGYSTLNAYVSELRERLEADPRKPRYVVTVRNVGYRLDP